MMAIIPNRKYFLGFSLILVALSYAVLGRWGLRLGIDYTGGALSEVEFLGTRAPASSDIQKRLTAEGFDVSSLQPNGERSFFIRMKSLDETDHQRYLHTLNSSFAASVIDTPSVQPATSTATTTPVTASVAAGTQAWSEKRFESIGPTIGKELRTKSLWAIVIAIGAIVLYITYSFRKVSRPVASWKYGVCAFVALVHDVSIPTGVMALMGHLRGWEVDILFVTALLTILGFSIHDTIVVYDRIRENLLKSANKNFEEIANASVNQTMARSINTSLTTIIVLAALALMGGASTRHFTLILIIGIFFGTYSSIFVASPLLVIWNRMTRR